MPQTQADGSSSNTSASFKIARVKPLGEPVVHRSEKLSPWKRYPYNRACSRLPRSRQSRAMLSGAKFPGLSFLLTRDRGPGEDEASVELAKLERR